MRPQQIHGQHLKIVHRQKRAQSLKVGPHLGPGGLEEARGPVLLHASLRSVATEGVRRDPRHDGPQRCVARTAGCSACAAHLGLSGCLTVPTHIRDTLVSRYEYIVAEREVVSDLQGDLRLCDICEKWIPPCVLASSSPLPAPPLTATHAGPSR